MHPVKIHRIFVPLILLTTGAFLQPAHAQPNPIQPSRIQPSPIQPNAAQHTPAQPNPAQLDPARPASILLWPGGAPQQTQATAPDTARTTPQGETVLTHVIAPTITPYLPSRKSATGAAVLIIPGGGHSEVWIDHEGYHVAELLSRQGIAAFVLTYRLARERDAAGVIQATYTVEGTELGDVQRAIRLVRSRAAEWGVNPARIGVMGFSAGGELALLANTRYDVTPSTGPIDALSSKPDFQALLYPAQPRDKRLTASTPPAFLACGADDQPAIAQALPELYLALARLHVPAELHIYSHTGHGFGVRSNNPQPVADWPQLFLLWLDKLYTPVSTP